MLNKSPLVGYTVEPFQGLSPSLILVAMRAIGVQFVEISQRSLYDVTRMSQKMGDLVAAFHLPYVHDDGFDFSSGDADKEIQALITLLNDQRRNLRLQHVVTHPPEGADQTEAAWQRLIHHLKQLDLPVCLENVFTGQPELFEQQSERMRQALGAQWAGVCFDACHFYIAGMDPVQQWLRFHPRVRCLHLSDCLPTEDTHLPFDCGGDLPVGKLLAAIKGSHFNGVVTLEIKPPSVEDVSPYLFSYLETLKHLHFQKYLRTRVRLSFIKPILSFLLK